MEEAKKKATSMMNFMSGKANSMFGGSKKEKKANPQDAMSLRDEIGNMEWQAHS